MGLRASKLFSELLAAELHSLERTAQLRTFKAGRQIFQQGERGDGLYIIAHGRVAITVSGGAEQPCMLARLGPGDFFGEMALLDEQPRSATATAEDDTEAYFILRDDLWRVLRARPQLVVRLLGEFSQRMRDFNQRYVLQMLHADRLNLVGRLAYTLVRQFTGPLNAIRSAADAAAAASATPAARADANVTTRKQVDRMNNLINEFLEFTRRSSATTVLVRTNYADFVRPIIDDLRAELAGRSVTFEIENDPSEVSVLIDPARMAHLFHNLIHCACDGLGGDGVIRMRFSAESARAVTEIQVRGTRAPREITEQMFEAFSQSAAANAVGLELAICRRIIEDHHGGICARTDPQGGTNFVFHLPIARNSTSTGQDGSTAL